jgi:hypothetical protein
MLNVEILMKIAVTIPSAIDSETRRSNIVFLGYIAFLVVTALGVAYLTYLTWDAGNRLQEAVQSNADARILEAGQKAAEAQKSASEADERSKTLEASNLILRGQVATLEKSSVDAS